MPIAASLRNMERVIYLECKADCVSFCLKILQGTFTDFKMKSKAESRKGFMIHCLFRPLAHMLLSCLCLSASATLNDFLTILCVLLPLIPYEGSFLHLEHSFPKFSPTFLNLTNSNSVFRSFLILLPHESLP